MDPQLYERFYEVEDDFWWSVATRRIFFDLIDGIRRQGHWRALDVGCGTGVTLKEFPPGWALVAGCDFSALALSFCQRRGLRTLARCDATRLPFASGSLDLITALDVIEHLDQDGACLAEIARVCRPGGHVLIHVPAFRILWSDRDEINHHRRRYRRNELVALVKGAGLTVERVFYINCAIFPIAFLRALLQRLRESFRERTSAPPATALDHMYQIPKPLNRMMLGMMELERRIVTRYPVPFGMSLVCLARK